MSMCEESWYGCNPARCSSHELQRLLAERDGAVAVLKRQLADAEGQAAAAEGKYRSGHEGTEPELRGRLQEAERRSGEMARELGSKSAALAAMERWGGPFSFIGLISFARLEAEGGFHLIYTR